MNSYEGDSPYSEHLATLRREILAIESRIESLHSPEHPEADINGIGLTELTHLPDDWISFVADGEDVLALEPAEAAHLQDLLHKLRLGVLGDPSEEKSLEAIIQYKARFDSVKETKH
ncbi:MAG: hypothetical protein AAB372_03725 [Patescibacteria group bacterium]